MLLVTYIHVEESLRIIAPQQAQQPLKVVCNVGISVYEPARSQGSSQSLDSTKVVLCLSEGDEPNSVTEPTNYTKLSKKITRWSRQFSELKPI
jgi:hypothetical protein